MATKEPKPKKVEYIVDGITVRLDPNISDDAELFDCIVILNNYDNLYSGAEVNNAEFKAIQRLFGDDLPKVMDQLRDKTGMVSSRRRGELFWKVLGELAKN